MSTGIKLSKAQIFKRIQLGGLLGKTLGKLGKKVLLDLVVPLAKDTLRKLATKATSSVLKKIAGQGSVRAGRRFTLFTSNEDIYDIIKIVESLEKSGLLIDGASETVKHDIKKQKRRFLPAMMAPVDASWISPMASLLVQPIASSLINFIT